MIYTHGAGLDRPLSLLRAGYGREDVLLDPFVVVPHYDWRGLADEGTSPSGMMKELWSDTDIDWPGRDARAYLGTQVEAANARSWFGGLIAQQRTAEGSQYMRNRYYDPMNGRFTQEDPIGLAGGMNQYGFAGGDPVNISDPFGLMGCEWGKIQDCKFFEMSGRHSPERSQRGC